MEQVKRVNVLSKELLKHGFAETMDEAVKMANRMAEKRGEGLNITEKTTAVEETDHGLEIRRVKTAINELKETIEKQKDDVQRLHSRIAELVSEMEKLKTRPVEIPQENKQTRLPKEEKKDHPRSGKYKPDDVAVDKFFYYGQK